jgi:hypothetical protein
MQCEQRRLQEMYLPCHVDQPAVTTSDNQHPFGLSLSKPRRFLKVLSFDRLRANGRGGRGMPGNTQMCRMATAI